MHLNSLERNPFARVTEGSKYLRKGSTPEPQSLFVSFLLLFKEMQIGKDSGFRVPFHLAQKL